MPQLPLAGRRRQSIGISNRPYSPGLSHGRDAGRVVFESTTRSIFDNDGSLEEQRFPGDNDESFWMQMTSGNFRSEA